MARRYQNKGEVVSEIPLDYWERWDASTSEGMTFTTDEATGDIATWAGQVGNESLSLNGTGTVPLWTAGQVEFAEGRNLRGDASIAARDATSATFFAVAEFYDVSTSSTGNRWGVVAWNDSRFGYINNANPGVFDTGAMDVPTNDMDNISSVWGVRNVHVGTDDNDITTYLGTTTLGTLATVADSALNGSDYICLGSYTGGDTWQTNVRVSELIIYDRALTSAEVTTVANYLSAKWQAQNEDDAGSVIADPISRFPQDYWDSWDASTSQGMAFATDEDTGDISGWVGKNGYELVTDGTGTRGTWTPGKLTWPGVELQQVLYSPTTMTYFDNRSFTVICASKLVAGHDIGSVYTGPFYYNRLQYLTADLDLGLLFAGSTGSVYPTNSITGIAACTAIRLGHTGTNDEYDVDYWFGADGKQTGELAVPGNPGRLGFSIGAADDAGFYNHEGEFYELLLYDRALTDAEIEKTLDYLSAKWQAQNDDSASTVIADYDGLGYGWTSREPDPEGKTLARHTPINHRVEPIRDLRAPRRKADPLLNSNDYPAFLPNLQLWYRSDYTGGMTFVTGDATSGGTVSSWDDITGNFTSDTTSSGDSDVTFHAGGAVKGGWPSVEGGSAGTPRSLEATAAVAANNDTGQQRLYWSVGTLGDASLNSSWGGPASNLVFCGSSNNFATDMVAKPFVNYVGTVTAPGINYTIADAGLPADDGRIHVSVWRVTDTGANADVESWYAGLKLPTRDSSTADSDPRAAIGALGTSNFDAEGAQFLEQGIALSTTATIQTYTDGQVESLIRYLCDRYDVPFMPPNAPITIGCWSRQTASNALTDCCLWHDPSTIGAQDWPLHPNVAQYHTTPTNFTLQTGAVSTAIPMNLHTDPTIKSVVVSCDERVSTDRHQESPNSYVSTETTDFPADTLGMSHYLVVYIDSETSTASGARCGSTVAQLRNVSGTQVQIYGGSSASGYTPGTDEWVIIGAAFAYDDDSTGAEGYPGSTDGDPACYFYKNDEGFKVLDTASNSSFNVQVWNNWDIADGVCSVAEHFVYKHPLTIEELTELRKYVLHKYPSYKFGFTHISAHHVDEATVAHWEFNGDSLDSTGNKAVFDTGTYVSTTLPNPNRGECHNHASGGGFAYNAQDSDLDTLGAFTWGAAIYLDSLPTSSNWRPIVRSSPPSGGTGLNNNHRYTFRIMDDGTLQYQHQYATKQNVSELTTMTVPVQEWFYLGLSRAEDGLSVNIIVNDTIETLSGFVSGPENGANARFELFESWDGDDFRGDAYSVIFKNVASSPGELLAMRNQVFNEGN